MESVKQTILEQQMFNPGDVVAVACSGGSDSIALLYYLNENKDDLDIEVIAINVDHCLRENSAEDSAFVARFCRDNHIRCMKFKVDCNQIAKSKGLSIEAAAREARYGVFETVIKKQMADKIAIAHHVSDQAETVLLHLFRGCGISGTCGMDFKRDAYVRPMLATEKNEILAYIYENHLEYVDDETNLDIKYQRNFVRNKIMPMIRSEWPAIEKTLCSFADICREDNDCINKMAPMDSVLTNGSYARIPLTYFIFDTSVVSRTITKAFAMIGINENIERKHINMIKDLVDADNGAKIDLPGVHAIKEYEYITLVRKAEKQAIDEYAFKVGKLQIPGYGLIVSKRTKVFNFTKDTHLVDSKLIPKNAVWRKREDNDMITKFGGGTKKLKSFLIEKKVPARLRDNLPVLAVNNEILIVAGVEISDKVKITDNTVNGISIEYFPE